MPEESASPTPSQAIKAISDWVDNHLEGTGKDPEAILLHRVIKLWEECGEVATALIEATHANPRKDGSDSFQKAVDELLDVAVASLGAVQHLLPDADTFALAEEKALRVARRAGVIA